MMKRIVCILSIFALLFTVCSCADKTPPSIVGTWVYSNHADLKEYFTGQIDDSYFYRIYYQFNEDGSGSTWVETYPDQKRTFTYTFDGEYLSVSLSDGSIQKLECEFHETYFYVSDGKEDMKFEKIN